MKLQQLQILMAVVEHGGIRAASRNLHLSQSAVTKAMRTLEETAGVPLLIRKARGIALTEAGDRVLARARVIARQVELAQEDLQQMSGQDSGTVRLGITPLLAMTGLGMAFKWFRQRFKNVDILITEGLVGRVVPRLRDGTLDIAVVAADFQEKAKFEEFTVRMLKRTTQSIVVREGHPILSTRPDAAGLAALEWVATAPLLATAISHTERMFLNARVTPPGRVVICDALVALSLVRHSDSACVLPTSLLGLPETGGIVEIKHAPVVPDDLELLLLTRPDMPLTPAAEYFTHCLTEVSKGLLPA